ncbi:GAF domain-containing protein [Deinococcus koreensis]|uniref:histidine kinase n=1 Tax=Deinococcus koreensis TaxID=2054903 RepID=A0A2K3USG9_9DEIO|nr:GAF domain-containing protein [Deinococcus koreensis]PNY79457.1 hypothetical protein CVO96_18640 [Deinococcus koreensis]
MLSQSGTDIPLSEHLHTVTEALAAARTLQAMLGVVLNTALDVLHVEAGAVLLVDSSGEHLEVAASRGHAGGPPAPWLAGSPAEPGPVAEALRRREPVWPRPGHPGPAVAAVPLLLEGQPLGVLALDFGRPRPLTPPETRFLRSLAGHCALALGRTPRALSLLGRDESRAGTEHRAQIEHRAEVLAALGDALQRGTTPQELADLALGRIGPGVQAQSMLFLSLDGDALRLTSEWGEVHEAVTAVLTRPDVSLRDTPILRGVVQGAQALYLDNYRLHQHASTAFPAQAVGVEPIVLPSGQVAGALVAMRPALAGTWHGGERDLLARAAGTLGLALERAQAAAHLAARAQEAFVAFTEAVGTETDVLALTRQAVAALQARFPGSSAAFYEPEDGLWKARAWSDDLGGELLALITDGLPETPLIREVLAVRQGVFLDAWDAEREGVAHSEPYTTVANVPLILAGEVRGILGLALQDAHRWNERDRAMVRAIGRGLTLALERAEHAARLSAQNAELDARTRALEGFASLTRDLSLEADAWTLIRRAQEVALSLLPEGYAVYFEPEDGRWVKRAQTGDLRSAALQAVADAGLPYEDAGNLLTPYTTRMPFYQDFYARDTDRIDDLVAHLGASATLPVLVEGQSRGVFAVVLFGEARHWRRPDQAALESVVRSLGLALERAEGLARLEARTSEVAQWRERYEVAVRGSGHLLYDWNPATGEVVYGGALEEITGYAAHELEGTLEDWAGRLIHPDDREAFSAEIARVVHSGEEFHLGFRIVRKDGAVADVEDDGYVKRGEDGRLTRMVGFVKDVTARRQAQAALLRANEELRRSNADLEQFAYIASHDLQAPIRAVTSFGDILALKYSGQLDERGQRYLRYISESGRHMKKLVDDLLTFSRIATDQRPPALTAAATVLDRVVQRFAPEIEALDAEVFAGELPTVLVDGQQLDQLFQNLLGNALKYQRAGVPPRIGVSARRAGDFWSISVADNGIGIDPSYFDRIFVIFQRLHGRDTYEGTGIGLAVCKKIVERHGGQLWVESAAGEGSTFHFTLPAG